MSKTTSVIQIEANRNNARKSTGPKTARGKQTVANNALKHGLFARQLLLADEDPEEYRSLADDLQAGLQPVGALELSLVERITVTLWRQRRLVRAETAVIELDRKARHVAQAVNAELGLDSFSDKKITDEHLTRFDCKQLRWSKATLAQIQALDRETLTDWERMKKSAPLVFERLVQDADEEFQSIEDYLQGWGEPHEYFLDLALECQNQIKAAAQRPMVLAVAELVRSQKAIPKAQVRDTLSRYQIMLDSELYKALKALREAQEWQLKSLEAQETPKMMALFRENRPETVLWRHKTGSFMNHQKIISDCPCAVFVYSGMVGLNFP